MNGSPRARTWELDGYNILQPAVFLFGGSAASGEPGKTCGYLAGPGQVRTRALFVHHWAPNDLFDDAQNEIEMGKREVIDTCKQIVHLQLTSFALILLRCLISLSKIPLQREFKSCFPKLKENIGFPSIFPNKTDGHWRWVLDLLPRKTISQFRSNLTTLFVDEIEKSKTVSDCLKVVSP